MLGEKTILKKLAQMLKIFKTEFGHNFLRNKTHITDNKNSMMKDLKIGSTLISDVFQVADFKGLLNYILKAFCIIIFKLTQ